MSTLRYIFAQVNDDHISMGLITTRKTLIGSGKQDRNTDIDNERCS